MPVPENALVSDEIQNPRECSTRMDKTVVGLWRLENIASRESEATPSFGEFLSPQCGEER
jgi:hypothetical protein